MIILCGFLWTQWEVSVLHCPSLLCRIRKYLDESHPGFPGLCTWNRMPDAVLRLLAFDTWQCWWRVCSAPGRGSRSAATPFSSFSLLQRSVGPWDDHSSSYRLKTSYIFPATIDALWLMVINLSNCPVSEDAQLLLLCYFVELRINTMDFPEKPTKFLFFFFKSELQKLSF